MNQVNKIGFRIILILCITLLNAPFINAEDIPAKIAFSCDIQPFWCSDIVQALTSMDDTYRILWLDQTAVFSGTNLTGRFTMRNRTADTLKLSPRGIPLVQYLKLFYTSHLDSSIALQEFQMQIKETVTTRGDYTQPIMSGGSVLLPHATIELDVTCLWEDLLKIAPTQQIIDFQFIWDNTAAAAQDSSIYGIRFAGRSRGFNINKIPATRADTLYSLYLQAFRQTYGGLENMPFSGGDLQAGFSLCQQMMQIDSLNFWACRTATDALWKLERFDEAAIYANKGVNILEEQLPSLINPKVKSDTQFYIKSMQDRFDLIEKHEPFRIMRLMQ
ncbi:MAG: hypothetical protein NTW14_08860 [bacterium]|nr:hypothetical protein [bacterium]